jgi:hypothetical protein
MPLTPWGLLGQTWDQVQIPLKLDQDIEEETTKIPGAAMAEGLTSTEKRAIMFRLVAKYKTTICAT